MWPKGSRLQLVSGPSTPCQWSWLGERPANQSSREQSRGGGHLLFTGAQVNQRTSTCRLWATKAVTRRVMQPSTLSLTTVWPTRAGSSSGTQGTFRQEAYPEPGWAHSHSPQTINTLLAVVPAATTIPVPLLVTELQPSPGDHQHNQLGRMRTMKYIGAYAAPLVSLASQTPLAHPLLLKREYVKVENDVNNISVGCWEKNYNIQVLNCHRKGRREKKANSQPLSLKTQKSQIFIFTLLFKVIRRLMEWDMVGGTCPDFNLGVKRNITKPPRLFRQENHVIKWPYITSYFLGTIK